MRGLYIVLVAVRLKDPFYLSYVCNQAGNIVRDNFMASFLKEFLPVFSYCIFVVYLLIFLKISICFRCLPSSP